MEILLWQLRCRAESLQMSDFGRFGFSFLEEPLQKSLERFRDPEAFCSPTPPSLVNGNYGSPTPAS